MQLGSHWNVNRTLTRMRGPSEAITRHNGPMKATRILWATTSLMVALTAEAQTWTGTDVGGPGLPGSHTGTPPGLMTVIGGGADIWGTWDQFYYVYATV